MHCHMNVKLNIFKTKTSRLMLFGEIIAVCSEKQKNQMNKLRE